MRLGAYNWLLSGGFLKLLIILGGSAFSKFIDLASNAFSTAMINYALLPGY